MSNHRWLGQLLSKVRSSFLNKTFRNLLIGSVYSWLVLCQCFRVALLKLFLFASWYKRSEFGIRAALFFSAATVSGAFGGGYRLILHIIYVFITFF